MRSPNNYFLGTTRQTNRPCECCLRPVKIDDDKPEVYGSGRFCSKVCAKLRTPEKHHVWRNENSEEYEAWNEWKTTLEEKKVGMPGINTGGNNEIILPVS